MRRQRWAAAGLALALLAPAGALTAQSVSEFRLPPSSPTATPTNRAPGPVDADAPVVRTRPTATPAPQPSQPAPQPGAAAPVPTPSAAAPRAEAAPAPRPAASTAAAPTPASPSPSAAAALPSAEPTPVVIQTMEALPSHSDTIASLPWYWFAITAGVIAVLFGLWQALRRKSAAPADEYEDYEDEVQVAEPSPAAVPLAATPPLRETPPPEPAPKSAPVPAANDGPIAVALEAAKLSVTIINATLNYRLVIGNRQAEVLTGLIIAGDMVAAHASLPVERQLATDGQPLELRHEIDSLAPGEQRELVGELRLPLSAINPIRSGTSLLFIPLVRMRVETTGANVLAAWVVGEAPQVAGGGVQPFRLDLGPRVYTEVSQRRIELAD